MESIPVNPDFIAPCGLYCGVCAILMAHRDNNQKFKERLLSLYQGGVPGKGTLPEGEKLSIKDIKCRGCLSGEPFIFCRQCKIKECTRAKGISGCHQCDAFPCRDIEDFPMAVGKKVIMRTIPYWREVGTERWVQDEEARYVCPECGQKVFRGAARCNRCKIQLDLD